MSPSDDSPNPRPSRNSEQPPGTGADHRAAANAFSAEFLDRLRRHHDHPPTPEAANAGPWRVIRSGRSARPGEGPVRSDRAAAGPSWECVSAGEAEPRAHLVTPDLAFLTASAFPLTGVPESFFLAEDPDSEAPLCDLLEGDVTVGVVDGWNGELAYRMSTLDALRRRPLALAHFLLAVGDETLQRVGRILVELAEDEAQGE